MLKKLLTYSGSAALVQLATGFLTLVVTLCVAHVLSDEGFGEYESFMLVCTVLAGPFVVGIDHALVAYINWKRPENYGYFLRLFMAYALALAALFCVVGVVATPFVHPITLMGIFAAGPFIVVELGKLVFRAQLDRRREFGFLLSQSLIWSLGCLATIWFIPSTLVPVIWSIVAFVVVAVLMIRNFVTTLRARNLGLLCKRPFGSEYSEFWATYRPLWIAGAAFLANTHITRLLILGGLGFAELGAWGFMSQMQQFIQKPLTLVQRAALPMFSREEEDHWSGFTTLVRLNLIVFPVLALGVLGTFAFLLRLGSFEEKYAYTWPLLAIVLLSAPMMAVEFLVATMSMAKKFPRNNRNAHVLAAFVNVPVSTGLVVAFGLWGAAAAAVFYTHFFGGCMFWFARKDLPDYVAFAARRLVAAILCLAAATWVLSLFDDRVVGAPIAILAYLGLALATGVFGMKDVSRALAFLRSIRERRKGSRSE